ncbi:MAG: biotin/lipoyl-containing protein [Elusimicrobiota bacterium]
MHPALARIESLYRKMLEAGALAIEVRSGPGRTISLKRRGSLAGIPGVERSQLAGSGLVAEPLKASVGRVVAPLSGVFYRSPSPSAPVFVNTGTSVNKGDVLCIIEAMKVLNEIKAPMSGKVSRIEGVNGKHVKKGDIIFIIDSEV